MIKGVGTCEPQLCIAHWPSCICIYGGGGGGGGVPSIGHLMKFTHRNFPFYWVGCFLWLGLMLYRLRLLLLRPANPQWVIWVVGSNPAIFHNKFVFSFKLKRLAL